MKTSSQRDGRHLHLTWRDVIDAVRKLTATVQPNEQNFDAASDVRGAAFCILSPDGHFVSANDSTGAIFGYSGNELIGHSLVDMAANGGRQDIIDGLSRCASGRSIRFVRSCPCAAAAMPRCCCTSIRSSTATAASAHC